MKIKSIYEELLVIFSNSDITIRKDVLLKSKGGYCLLNDSKLLILNKNLPIESQARILANCIVQLNLLNSDLFITPAIREFIENEASISPQNEEVEFVV
jgi:hypothetical protein